MLVRSFADRGFLVLDDIGIDGFEATADRVRAEVGPLHEDGKYNRVIDAWTTSEAVHTVATARRVMELLEVLYGHRPIPFQTLSFLRGSQQRTHSDTYHFHSYPKHFMCGVWVACEDIWPSNGPLHHLLPRVAPPSRLRFPVSAPQRRDVAFVDELIPAYGLEKQRAY
jgi:ectoine hydroxylase-related dioxygenase (phytanoyl-CoA dioxygenase family)